MKNLLKYLSDLDDDNEYEVLLSSIYQKDLLEEIPSGIQGWFIAMPRFALLRIIWEQFVFPFIIKRKKFDLLFNVAELAPLIAKIDLVLLVRNLNIFSTTEERKQLDFVSRIKSKARFVLSKASIRKATWVVFPSETMRDRVRDAIDSDIKRSSVIHYGVSEFFGPGDQLLKDNEESDDYKWGCYILYVSSLAPHKNHVALIDAFSLVTNRGYPNLHLLLVGGSYYTRVKMKSKVMLKDKIEELIQRKSLKDKVVMTGHLDIHLLPEIYSHAKLFVFPAIRESFGHPLVEAMASGLPVLAADLPYAREICADAAIYFDTADPEELASKICSVLDSDRMRESLSQRSLARATCFKWENTFKETVNVFRTIEEEKGKNCVQDRLG